MHAMHRNGSYRKCTWPVALCALILLVSLLGYRFHGRGGSVQTADNANRQRLALKFEGAPPRVVSALLQSTAKVRKGYIMGLHSVDQLTGGAMNFMIYQCLAAHMGPNVYTVEPFEVESSFGAFIWDIKSKEDFAEKNDVRLSDVYDMDEWYRFSDSLGIRRMPPWEELLEEGSRQLIYVTKGAAPCHHEPQFEGFFKAFDFKIVRTVCLGGSAGIDDLKKKNYGDFDPTTVVVLFRWYWIMSVPGTSCNKGTYWGRLVNSLTPSKRIWANTDAYMKNYLGSQSNNYVSMMIRLEHTVIHSGGQSRTEVVKHCLNKLLEQWREISSSNGLNTTFITLDTGRFGSNTLTGNAGGESLWNQTQAIVNDFMHSLYGNRLSYDAWERSFLDVSGLTKGSEGAGGYIAILQKAIASRGRCIILVGGGTFQENAGRLFAKLHPGQVCKNTMTC